MKQFIIGSYQYHQQEDEQLLTEISHQLRQFNQLPMEFDIEKDQNKSNFNLRKYVMKIIEAKILQYLSTQQKEFKNFKEQWTIFERDLIAKQQNEKDFSLDKVISFVQENLKNEMDQDQITQIIYLCQLESFSVTKFEQIFQEYSIDNLIKIPGITYIIAIILFNFKNLNKFKFYNLLLFIIIQQELQLNQFNQDLGIVDKILEQIEINIINQIVSNNNGKILDEFLQSYSIKVRLLLKQKQIIDFFVAQYFNRWLSSISDCEQLPLNNEINTFITIRDQSNVGKLNFTLTNFIGSLNFLKEQYQSNKTQEMRLIKMVKASALIPDFEQEAGNSFTLLSRLNSIILNQDFSNINLKNSSLNNIQFLHCNFSKSVANNVNIVSTQFIDCQLQRVSWTNLESSCLKIKEKQILGFSGHKSILISQKFLFTQTPESIKGTISFINLLTNKQLKTFYNENRDATIVKKNFKISCLGQVLATQDKQTSIFLSIPCLKKIRVFKSRINYIHVLSPDSKILAILYQNQIHIWKVFQNQSLRIESQNLTKQLSSPFNQGNSLFGRNERAFRFSKDSKIIMFEGKKVLFWKVLNGEETYQWIKSDGVKLSGCKFSADRKKIAIIEERILENCQKLAIMDIESRKILRVFSSYHIRKPKFSPDGEIFIFCNDDQIFMWKGRDYLEEKIFNYNLYVKQIKFSLEGETLIFPNQNCIVFWKFNQERFFYLEGQLDEIQSISVSHDQTYLISQGLNNNNVYLWKLGSIQKLQNNEFPAIQNNISFLSFSSSINQYVGFIYNHQTIQIRDLGNNMKVIHELNFAQRKSKFLILSPDLNTFASLSDSEITVLKIENCEEISSLKLEDETIDMIEFSPDGQYLAAYRTKSQFGKQMNKLIVWNIYDSTKIKSYKFKTGSLHSFRFFNDSSSFAVGLDSEIKLLNINSSKEICLRDSSLDPSSAIAISPNNQLLAACNKNSQRSLFGGITCFISIWQINDGKIIQKIIGIDKQITKLVFLINEVIIVSVSEDFRIQVWNAAIGQQIQVLSQHKSQIQNLSISSDYSFMISSDGNGQICLWRYEPNNFEHQQLKNNPNQQNQYFTLCQIIGYPRFRAQRCSVEGSQLYSSEGYNLLSAFATD